MLGLNHFGAFKFHDDLKYGLAGSAWFSVSDRDEREVPLRLTSLYHEDRLGLQQLQSEGKIHFYKNRNGHMYFEGWEYSTMLAPLLFDETPKGSRYKYFEEPGYHLIP